MKKGVAESGAFFIALRHMGPRVMNDGQNGVQAPDGIPFAANLLACDSITLRNPASGLVPSKLFFISSAIPWTPVNLGVSTTLNTCGKSVLLQIGIVRNRKPFMSTALPTL